VLKSFAQARQFIYIDPKELLEAKEWIVSWQQQSGAFPPVGKIWNKDIQAGVDGDVALTAYVTVALIESGFEREVGNLPTKNYTVLYNAYFVTSFIYLFIYLFIFMIYSL